MRRAALAFLCLAGACGGGASATDASVPDAPVTPDAPVAADAAPPRPDATPAPDAAPPLPGTTCAGAITLVPGAPATASTTDMVGSNLGAPSCEPHATGPERYFVVDAGATPTDLIVDVLVDEQASPPFDVVLSARAGCGAPATELGCGDAGWGERLEVLAATGPVHIVVDGSTRFGGQRQGAFTIAVNTRPVRGQGQACDPAGVSSRCGAGLFCPAGTCAVADAATTCAAAIDVTADLAADQSATLTVALPATGPDLYAASCAVAAPGPHPERLVRFATTKVTHLVASTDDPATTVDTVLALRAADCQAELACADDVDASQGEYRSRLDVAALPAGTYVLEVAAESGLVFGAPTTPRTAKLTITTN